MIGIEGLEVVMTTAAIVLGLALPFLGCALALCIAEPKVDDNNVDGGHLCPCEDYL